MAWRSKHMIQLICDWIESSNFNTSFHYIFTMLKSIKEKQFMALSGVIKFVDVLLDTNEYVKIF